MNIIKRIQDEVGLTPALAQHFYQLLIQDYADLPRMEAYRLRRYMRKHNTEIYSAYGKGYRLLPEDKKIYTDWFKIP